NPYQRKLISIREEKVCTLDTTDQGLRRLQPLEKNPYRQRPNNATRSFNTKTSGRILAKYGGTESILQKVKMNETPHSSK
ncbi:5_t:CDS:2, partial [Paraglomus occultum]